ncbi:MAG: hypothetical protein SGARI_006397, partial [Bacillariaceae sp.]
MAASTARYANAAGITQAERRRNDYLTYFVKVDTSGLPTDYYKVDPDDPSNPDPDCSGAWSNCYQVFYRESGNSYYFAGWNDMKVKRIYFVSLDAWYYRSDSGAFSNGDYIKFGQYGYLNKYRDLGTTGTVAIDIWPNQLNDNFGVDQDWVDKSRITVNADPDEGGDIEIQCWQDGYRGSGMSDDNYWQLFCMPFPTFDLTETMPSFKSICWSQDENLDSVLRRYSINTQSGQSPLDRTILDSIIVKDDGMMCIDYSTISGVEKGPVRFYLRPSNTLTYDRIYTLNYDPNGVVAYATCSGGSGGLCEFT